MNEPRRGPAKTKETIDLRLRWGNGFLEGRLEAGEITVLEPDDPPALPDPAKTVVDATRARAFGPTLSEAVRGARRPVVVVSDKTRKTGVRRYLRALVDEIREACDPAARIALLVAYGNHARHTPEDDARVYGPIPAGAVLFHHDSRDPSRLKDAGALPSGRRLVIAREAAESDALVLTGGVTFHYHAGFTGGRKAILPGVASYENVIANHALTLVGREGRAPRPWGPGILEGNPVSDEMDAAIKRVAPAYAVQTVMAGDEIGAVFAGDPVAAHRTACAEVARRYSRPLDAPADLVIASAGGFPKDIDFYQSHKALDNAARACRDGGVVVLAAACDEGVGSDAFARFLAFGDEARHLAALRRSFEVPGQTALALREKTARVRVILVSRLDAALVLGLGLMPAADLGDALRLAREVLGGPSGKAVVLPRASETLPISARG